MHIISAKQKSYILNLFVEAKLVEKVGFKKLSLKLDCYKVQKETSGLWSHLHLLPPLEGVSFN